MIASIISVINGVIQLALGWMTAARDKLLRSLGVMEQKQSDLKGQLDADTEADKVREDARADVERHGDGGLLNDDGFKRDDDAAG